MLIYERINNVLYMPIRYYIILRMCYMCLIMYYIILRMSYSILRYLSPASGDLTVRAYQGLLQLNQCFVQLNSKRFATPADPLLPMDVCMFRHIDIQQLYGSPPSERTSWEELATQTPMRVIDVCTGRRTFRITDRSLQCSIAWFVFLSWLDPPGLHFEVQMHPRASILRSKCFFGAPF